MTRVYQAADGRWIVFSNGVKSIYFNTESEARIMANKLTFAGQAQAFCTSLAALFKEAKDLDAVYFSEGFDGAGSDPITDADLVSLGITAAEVSAADTMLQQITNFQNDIAVVTGDYKVTVNAMRTDV